MSRIAYLVVAFAILSAGCKKEEPEPPAAPAATTPPPAPAPNDPLTMGNPSGAIASVVLANNYLIERPQFSLAYDNSRGTASWVAWHLSSEWLGPVPRCDCFSPDPLLPNGYFVAFTWNYTNTGFNRGHLCPSGDRTATDADNVATFFMTNICPQAPVLNQQTWAYLESFSRDLAYAGYELYIYAGGYGSGGSGSLGGITYTIANGSITVPERYWKVMLILPVGEDDLQRITSDTRIIALDMPNTQQANAQPWYDYRTSVDEIEAVTGLDFFNGLPVALQASLEAGVDAGVVH
ncbi:MAG: DNA/RNA non-specific endonuclease [Flavobacteriales bacterium]|nr:DNA/RNA non-specific endonuclease [Flavobacteriales bacterium]